MSRTAVLLTGAVMSIVLGLAGIAGAKPAAVQTTEPGAAEWTPDPLTGRQAAVTRLKNGLSVLILKDSRFPLVSTRLYVHAGSVYEKPEQAGISHVLEHMVFKGTEHRPKGEVSRQVEAAGGYLNAATSYDYTVYITDMPARHWKLGLDVARDMAFNAILDPAELESEKQVVLSELDMRMKDNPRGRLFERLLKDSLQGTPYERPVIGYPETIRKLTVADLRAYIDTWYQPRNMLLVVVGDVNPPEVLAEAERLFGAYSNDLALPQPEPYDAGRLPLSAEGAPRLAPSVVVEPGPWNKVYLAAAFPVPGFADYRSAPLDVLAYLLGGDRTSLFYRTFKYERQLVDSISVSNVGFERVGLFMVSAELDADKAGAFWEALAEAFAKLDPTTFSAEELERAKVNLEDDMFRARETLSSLASQVGQFQFYHGGVGAEQAEENAIGALRAVSPAALAAVARDWLDSRRLSAVALTPRGASLPDFTALLDKRWPAGEQRRKAVAGASGAPEIVDLGQGRTLVLIPDGSLPYISVKLAYSGGDSLLDPARQGLSSLAAGVLTRGAAGRGAPEIQAFLSDRAAALAAASGRQTFTLGFTAPARFNDDLFGLLREVVEQPTFSPEETARGIRDQVAAVQRLGDQPLAYVLRRKLPPFLFPGSVYGYLQLGEPETVKTFTPDMLRAFWNEQKRRPFVLAVAGAFDRDKALAFARSLPAPQEGRADLPAPLWGADKGLDVRVPGRNQAHLMLVFKTVPELDPDSPAFDLLNAVLGGMGGPLFRDLRDEQGLGSTVATFAQQTEKTGFMAFYIGTTPEKIEQAEAGFRKILNSLAVDLLPEEELARGKNQLEGDYYREMQSLGSRAGEAALLTLEGRPLSFTRDQIEKARAVTPEMLRDLATRYLRPKDAYIIKVLP